MVCFSELINYKKRGRFLTDKVDIDGYCAKHMVEYYLDLLEFLRISPPVKPRLELFLEAEVKGWAGSFIKGLEVKRHI